MSKIVALIPMRHQSERVPGKNFRPCAGRPLFHHILQTLGECPEIAELIVDTDSPVIMDDVQENFPQVRILERPENLRAGTVPMNEVLLHTTSQVESDFYLQTHSTNPLLRPETISRAINTFLNHFPTNDSLFSVTRLQTRLWDQLSQPINHNPQILLRTQDLPPVYEENSCLYIFTREILETHRNRLGSQPHMFIIDSVEAWDIDEELDFQIVEFLMQTTQGERFQTGK